MALTPVIFTFTQKQEIPRGQPGEGSRFLFCPHAFMGLMESEPQGEPPERASGEDDEDDEAAPRQARRVLRSAISRSLATPEGARRWTPEAPDGVSARWIRAAEPAGFSFVLAAISIGSFTGAGEIDGPAGPGSWGKREFFSEIGSAFGAPLVDFEAFFAKDNAGQSSRHLWVNMVLQGRRNLELADPAPFFQARGALEAEALRLHIALSAFAAPEAAEPPAVFRSSRRAPKTL